MNKPNRLLALLNYVVPVVVPLYVILAKRSDPLSFYHATQSLALVAGALVTPVAWAIFAWIITWIPLVGGLLGAATFALVIATYLVIIYGWVMGIISAAQAELNPVPVFGDWGERFLP